MRFSWNEVRARAAVFAEDWKNTACEKGETQGFYDAFFEMFGCVDAMALLMNGCSRPKSSEKTLKTTSKSLQRIRRINYLNMLFHLPKRSGQPRQGDPVDVCPSTASRKSRLPAAVTLGSAALPGRSGWIGFRMALVSTVLPIFNCN